MNNEKSGETAISRIKMSSPMNAFLKCYGHTLENKSILDFGCGKGKDVEEALKLGYNIVGYDPNQTSFPIPKNNFDIVFCSYVLNVISKPMRIDVINSCWMKLKENGFAIFVSRTDKEINNLAKNKHWEPKEDGYLTGKGTFQKGFNISELSDLIKNSLSGKEFDIIKTNLNCKCSSVIIKKI